MVVVHENMEIVHTVLKKYHAALASTFSGAKCTKTLDIAQGLYTSAVSKQSAINYDVKLFY